MFVDLVDSEDVLKAVKARGPMLPLDIKRFLGKGDSITIGAALSTLLSKKALRCTKLKLGGSPFYFVDGQENKLELLSKHLNDKDKRVFEELRQKKVMKDASQEPLTRVSLRNIVDFAKKVEMTSNGEVVVYWRWYLVSEDEAISLIRGELQRKDLSFKEEVVEEQESEGHEAKDEDPEVVLGVEEDESKSGRDVVVEDQEDSVVEAEAEVEVVSEKKRESPPRREKKESKKVEEQTRIPEEVPDYDDDFFREIKSFLDDNGIRIKQAVLVRKGSDYELVVEMKTPFGKTDYFCKAKSKKKCNEGDLSSAYLQGQNKRLPTVFITTGEITKKAKQKAGEEYKGLLIKEL